MIASLKHFVGDFDHVCNNVGFKFHRVMFKMAINMAINWFFVFFYFC